MRVFEGNGSVVVNGVPVLPGESTILHNNAVVEFASLRFIFLVNLELNEAIRSEAVKNNFVKSLLWMFTYVYYIFDIYYLWSVFDQWYILHK